MGYHAPSAEEVYRYVLRLDGRRSLSDRFGFSIVLVNDSSRVCRGFLRSYCIDLCQRTADRIRFVFFSEVPEQEIQAVVAGLAYGRARRGLLQQILVRMGLRERYDYEREPWQSLRPEPLRPLRRLGDIEERLRWECDTLTAMPGAGMAMEFAQRLGIGRHVPCVLIFTEVGERHVDLLPISRLSPAEVFEHLRSWIDEFYEQNRARIDHWSAVEGEINELAGAAQSTLWEIRRWRDEQLLARHSLTSVASAIHAVEYGEIRHWKNFAEAVASDYSAQRRLRGTMGEFARHLGQLERRLAAGQEIAKAAQAVATSQTPETLLQELERWERKLPKMGVAISAWPEAVGELRRRLAKIPAARTELEAWWKRRAPLRLSRQRFKKERSVWANLRDSAEWSSGYRALLQAVSELPLSTDPATGAQAALDALASHWQLDSRSESWQAATASYRALVKVYIEKTVRTAPSWLLGYGASITLEKALPSPKEFNLSDPAMLLAARPALRRALAAAVAQEEPGASARLQEDEVIAAAWRDQIGAELHAASCPPSENEWRQVSEDALAELRQLRRQLEVEALAPPITTTLLRQRKRSLDRDLAERLHRALDEYEKVTQSIEFPHLKDPKLRRLPLAMPIVAAARVDAEANENPAERLRSSLTEALDAARQANKLEVEVEHELAAARPATRLSEALGNSLAEGRLEIVAAAFATFDITAAVERAIDQHRAAELLRSLTEQEIAAVSRALGATERDQGADSAGDRVSSERAVLLALGLYTGSLWSARDEADRRLQAKVAADEYDVFLAHNALDKPAVLDIARRLRRAGINPGVDIEQIPPGRWFHDVINAVIPHVRAAAILLGEHGLGRWQALEMRSFITQCVERGLPVIPVLLPGVEEVPGELLSLRELHRVRFQDGFNDKQAFDSLVWGITGERPPMSA